MLAESSAAAAGDVTVLTKSVEQWYAAAEAELTTQYGRFGKEDEVNYLGIGMHPVVIEESAPSRYISSPDALGLLGHRMDWTIRGLHLVLSLGPLIIQSFTNAIGDEAGPARAALARPKCEVHIDTLSRIGHRACAFGREPPPPAGGIDVPAFWPLVKRGAGLPELIGPHTPSAAAPAIGVARWSPRR